jgi:formate hydrogenlyase subunit 6/NADH:ubiquinone oxidoreductase subunit I
VTNKEEKIVLLVDYVRSCPAEAITMKAGRSKHVEETFVQRNMLCCVIFCGLCEDVQRRIILTTSKVLVLLVMKRRFYLERQMDAFRYRNAKCST